MLEVCREVGREALSRKNEAERKREFLKSQTIVPELPGDSFKGERRELVVNLNTKRDQIELKTGRELDSNLRGDFFGFELMGKAGRKIYATTNNVYYHLETIPDLISYVNDKFNEGKPEFIEFLNNLREQFYAEDSAGNEFLNLLKLEDRLLKKDIVQDFFDKQDDFKERNKDNYVEAFTKKDLKDPFIELFSKEILGSTRKSDAGKINICSLKINGEYLHKGSFQEDYVDTVYYDRHARFFENSESKVRNDKICSMCQHSKKVTGKIDVPTKFYITDKSYFFENGNDRDAYKSFALCEDCYQQLLHGIDQIQQDYQAWLFGCRYYLVPKNVSDFSDFENKAEYLLERVLTREAGSSHEETEKHLGVLNELDRQNIRFDFLFYFLDQASFNVVDLIPDVRVKDIKSILSTIDNLNQLPIYKSVQPLSLNHIYWLLFPNQQSHSNSDPEQYRKDLLGIFKSLLKGTNISYRTVLNRFNTIFARIYHRRENLDFILNRPLHMNQLLELFQKEAQLKGVDAVSVSVSITDVTQEELQKFFEIHEDIYSKRPARQGLVMLGYLMNGIWYEQDQEGKSSTVLDKLNFEGMSPRRMDRFINEITEYLKLYERWHYPETGEIHALMMDRLQEISESKLSKDEVLFYILTGFSLGRKIGIDRAQESTNGGEDDE